MTEIYKIVPPAGFMRNEIAGYKRKTMPTIERINTLLSYRDGMLFWRVDRGGHVKVGERAGNVHKSTGYRHIGIDGRQFREHQIIWMLAKQEELPTRDENGYELVMDHIDGDPLNNRIENLKPITQSENNAKQFRDEIKIAKNGDKLLTGVSQHGKRFVVKFRIRSYWRSKKENGGTNIAVSFPTQLAATAFKLFMLDRGHGNEILKLLNLCEEDQQIIDRLYSGEIGKTGHYIRDFTIKPEFQEFYDREIQFLKDAGF
ncbi:MAG: HNH endonuclease signature motif containing protein [Sphingobacteriaceae bacterium]